MALALKALGIRYARQNGYDALITRSANPAMVALNEGLGFRRGPSEVRLVRPVRPVAGEAQASAGAETLPL